MQRIVKRTIVSSGAGRPMKVQKKSGQGTRMARDSKGNLYEVTPLANAGGSLGGMLKGAASRLSNVARRPVSLTGLTRQVQAHAVPVSPTLTGSTGYLSGYSVPSTVLVARGAGKARKMGGGGDASVQAAPVATPAPVVEEATAIPENTTTNYQVVEPVGGYTDDKSRINHRKWLDAKDATLTELTTPSKDGTSSVRQQTYDYLVQNGVPEDQAQQRADMYVNAAAAYSAGANPGRNSWGLNSKNYEPEAVRQMEIMGTAKDKLFGGAKISPVSTPGQLNALMSFGQGKKKSIRKAGNGLDTVKGLVQEYRPSNAKEWAHIALSPLTYYPTKYLSNQDAKVQQEIAETQAKNEQLRRDINALEAQIAAQEASNAAVMPEGDWMPIENVEVVRAKGQGKKKSIRKAGGIVDTAHNAVQAGKDAVEAIARPILPELAEAVKAGQTAYETTRALGDWAINGNTGIKRPEELSRLVMTGSVVPYLASNAGEYIATNYPELANKLVPAKGQGKKKSTKKSSAKKQDSLTENEVRQMIKDEIKKVKNAGCGTQKKAGCGAKKKAGCGTKKSTPVNARTKKKSIR